jgi:hypothetical protein
VVVVQAFGEWLYSVPPTRGSSPYRAKIDDGDGEMGDLIRKAAWEMGRKYEQMLQYLLTHDPFLPASLGRRVKDVMTSLPPWIESNGRCRVMDGN